MAQLPSLETITILNAVESVFAKLILLQSQHNVSHVIWHWKISKNWLSFWKLYEIYVNELRASDEWSLHVIWNYLCIIAMLWTWPLLFSVSSSVPRDSCWISFEKPLTFRQKNRYLSIAYSVRRCVADRSLSFNVLMIYVSTNRDLYWYFWLNFRLFASKLK